LKGHSLWKAYVSALAFVAGPLSASDLEVGQQRYIEHCSKCHGVITERRANGQATGYLLPVVALPLGPNLSGIHGRAAGTVAGFRYSNAFLKAASRIVWNDENLDRWLSNSQAMIPGSYMFLKLEAAARRDIIAYLRAYASHPAR